MLSTRPSCPEPVPQVTPREGPWRPGARGYAGLEEPGRCSASQPPSQGPKSGRDQARPIRASYFSEGGAWPAGTNETQVFRVGESPGGEPPLGLLEGQEVAGGNRWPSGGRGGRGTEPARRK